jgi:hypothetical protein
MKKPIITLIIEENEGLLEGYIDGVRSRSLISASGKNETELIGNLRMLIRDYQVNEGVNDAAYQKIDADKVVFDTRYNISAFFAAHSYLKASTIAARANINTQLMSQYITGKKHPGANQVQKIEVAVKAIVKELLNVQLV